MTISDRPVTVHWLGHDDHDNLLELLQCCYRAEAWTKLDLMRFLHAPTRRNNIKVLTDAEHTIYGTLFYTIGTGTLTIRRLAVWPDYRRHGLGQVLLENLMKAGSPMPPKVLAFVATSNVIAQTFFVKTGFQQLDELDEMGRLIFEFQKPELRSPDA